MKFEIKSRRTGSVLFEAEIECSADASEGVKLGLAVKAAIRARANLAGANLRVFKADMWLTLASSHGEIPALVQALREGRINGSQYEGECACLVGTVANARGVSFRAIEHNPDHPAERWFAMINPGDKPGDDSGGGFAAAKALEWAIEYCDVHNIPIPEAAPAAETGGAA